MKYFVFILIILVLGININAQSNSYDSLYVLGGTVVNGSNNIALEGAHIITSRQHGTKTNEQGEFALNVHFSDTIKISFVGFKTLSYVCPHQTPGKYLIKFKLYKDSISLQEIEIFPYPTYQEFKRAFSEMNKENEKIEIYGVKTYQDRVIVKKPPSPLSPASFIYDKLFDKQAKLKRKLQRRRIKVNNSAIIK